MLRRCLRYCKSTIFQANHNRQRTGCEKIFVVCDTAKVRFFKQITTIATKWRIAHSCLRYCKSTIFQANHNALHDVSHSEKVVCDTAKVRFFKQITTNLTPLLAANGCLRYCKSTIFQANHNLRLVNHGTADVVCDTAKVRFFKQITTYLRPLFLWGLLFAILQKYDFSSKSQPGEEYKEVDMGCLRYCKSTIFQANHNNYT